MEPNYGSSAVVWTYHGFTAIFMVSLLGILRATAAFVYLCAIGSAAELTGRVIDPSGAAVPGVSVVLQSTSGQTLSGRADAEGRFTIKVPDGDYTLSIKHAGFRQYTKRLTISGAAVSISIDLLIEELRQVQDVTSRSTLANSDPIYRASRDSSLWEGFSIENLVIKRDVGVLTLQRGTVTFLTPVAGRVTGMVLIGQGLFTLNPALPIEAAHLRNMTGKALVEEPFERALLLFTDHTEAEVRKSAGSSVVERRAPDALNDLRRRIRERKEEARSMVEALLEGESMRNIDADIAADLHNPKQAGFFDAVIDGREHHDLRFFVRPRGVFPDLPSPEEVALVHSSLTGTREGIWYLSHYKDELDTNTASSYEDKRVAAAEHYSIETVIGGNERVTSTATIRFRCVNDGDRIVKFGLLPNLRVARVTFQGAEIGFIQQGRREDGSFHVVMPSGMKAGTTYTVTVEYGGDKVLRDEGGGNFAVGARTSWYPSLNCFTDRSMFDLTFKYPKRHKLVGVGKLVSETQEGDLKVARWVSDVPLAVAGFNLGQFKQKTLEDPRSKYMIEGYATTELPGFLKGASQIGGMTPSRLLDRGMAEAEASILIFQEYFGKSPYGRIAITQQPQMFFGQSWPTLVYLPIISFFDSTQRWEMFGLNNRLTEFVDEVTAHEVAHQWWGHMVGWATYRDQWLSEGFATFSAGLFLQATQPNAEKYLKYWDHARDFIVEKSRDGVSPNEAGPIWMGLRLNSYKNPNAYSGVVYRKGAYILHMLRQMMWNRETRDQRFKKMMQDFVQGHLHANASTESFYEVVQRHMTPEMDLEGNGSIAWFFRQWVYETEIPRYKFEYTIKPDADGKMMLNGKLTQSEVTERFRMLVPIYVDFGGEPVRIGSAQMRGSSSLDVKLKLPRKPKNVMVNAQHDVLARE